MKIYSLVFDIVGKDVDNIDSIVSVCFDKEDKWNGLKGKELKEALEYDDIGEIDGLPTPNIELQYNKEHRNFDVKMYHERKQKYIFVGETPKKYTETILYYLGYHLYISGVFYGGNFKTLGTFDNQIKEYSKAIQITMSIDVYA